jgi:nitrous oxidase accessory protein NosD
MPEKVAGYWIIAHAKNPVVEDCYLVYEWGEIEPAVLACIDADHAAELARQGNDMRPARVGYYGDEDAGVWLHKDGSMTEGNPVKLAERYG